MVELENGDEAVFMDLDRCRDGEPRVDQLDRSGAYVQSCLVANQNLASWRGLYRFNLYGPISSLDFDLKAKNRSRVETCTNMKFKFTFSPDTLSVNLVISSITCKQNQPLCVGDKVWISLLLTFPAILNCHECRRYPVHASCCQKVTIEVPAHDQPAIAGDESFTSNKIGCLPVYLCWVSEVGFQVYLLM